MIIYSEIRHKEFKYRGRWVDNWFSNLIPTELTIDGQKYNSVENFYQASKAVNPFTHMEIAESTPAKAKQLGRKCVMIPGWDQKKIGIMKKGLEAKWNMEPYRTQLIDSYPEHIVEWNNWGDRFWGVDTSDNRGENWLGRLLMDIRYDLVMEYKSK